MTFAENVSIDSKLSVPSLPKEQLIMHSAHTWPVVIGYWEFYNFWQCSSKLRYMSWAVFDAINILWHILLPLRQCKQHNLKMCEVSGWHCTSSSMVLSLNDWPCTAEVIIIHYWTWPLVWTRLCIPGCTLSGPLKHLLRMKNSTGSWTDKANFSYLSRLQRVQTTNKNRQRPFLK